MKHILAVIALFAITSPALAGPELTPTQEYRIWSAEQMVNRVVTRLGRMSAGCNNATAQAYFPKASEACEKSVLSLYPQLTTIRQIAAGGDDVLWAKVIDVVHKLEADTEPHLQTLGK